MSLFDLRGRLRVPVSECTAVGLRRVKLVPVKARGYISRLEHVTDSLGRLGLFVGAPITGPLVVCWGVGSAGFPERCQKAIREFDSVNNPE